MKFEDVLPHLRAYNGRTAVHPRTGAKVTSADGSLVWGESPAPLDDGWELVPEVPEAPKSAEEALWFSLRPHLADNSYWTDRVRKLAGAAAQAVIAWHKQQTTSATGARASVADTRSGVDASPPADGSQEPGTLRGDDEDDALEHLSQSIQDARKASAPDVAPFPVEPPGPGEKREYLYVATKENGEVNVELKPVAEVAAEALSCTNTAAVWCAKCGDCSCPRNKYGERTREAMRCPLHSPNSHHAEGAAELAKPVEPKSLGQIAREAYMASKNRPFWEDSAQAVRAEVLRPIARHDLRKLAKETRERAGMSLTDEIFAEGIVEFVDDLRAKR